MFVYNLKWLLIIPGQLNSLPQFVWHMSSFYGFHIKIEDSCSIPPQPYKIYHTCHSLIYTNINWHVTASQFTNTDTNAQINSLRSTKINQKSHAVAHFSIVFSLEKETIKLNSTNPNNCIALNWAEVSIFSSPITQIRLNKLVSSSTCFF